MELPRQNSKSVLPPKHQKFYLIFRTKNTGSIQPPPATQPQTDPFGLPLLAPPQPTPAADPWQSPSANTAAPPQAAAFQSNTDPWGSSDRVRSWKYLLGKRLLIHPDAKWRIDLIIC